MNEFRPTHRITWTPRNGSCEVIDVMACDPADLGDPGHTLYTSEEWEAADEADWHMDADGQVWHQGQATPGGANGAVTVERI